jgi:sensor histidine kinase YesM
LHILGWLIFIIFGTLNKIAVNPGTRISLAGILFTQLPSIYIFYVSNFVFFRFLSRRKYLLMAIAEIVFFVSYLLLIYVDGYWLAPLIDARSIPPPFHPGNFLVTAFWLFFLYSYFSFGYYFASRSIHRERQLRLEESKRLQAERDTLVAEYSFLRSQINPHFLHNTLNFFYAKSLGASQDLSDGILTLSEIMRYSLEDAENSNGKVTLARELENLKKVVKINQLRFSNKLNVDFSVTGDTEAVWIVPLILITLVENAFKHGELTNPQFPLSIRIEVKGKGSEFYFMTTNRKKRGLKEFGHGIGMSNVRKRLEYAYHENHCFTIKDEAETYSTELFIRFPEKEEETIKQP